ncbi:nucleotide exchange factor GrpE [Streptosporangium sp. NBC_01469]|uniref:nucleotide exchange factor GrpE n=1 Tax=Streptosporangium sp. NBC_01469 TaxID=2903898 RepID=UPI002E2C72BB|nr:nucleotide exchange factor GrpE [Streptosporangium sp. NBC_01469]
MRDRRAFLPLLLAWPVLTGCGAVTRPGGEAVGAPSVPLRDGGVRPLDPGEAGTVTVGTPFGFLPPPLVLAVAAGALAVVTVVAVGLYLRHRDRRPTPRAPLPGTWRAAPVPPGTPPFPAGGAGPAPGRPGADHAAPSADPGADPSADPLAGALAEVAASGISAALTQQVERLLAGGRPGREALVTACVDYRDQLAERHPRLAGTLLEALNRAGIREIVADGRRFDPRLHEAAGTEPAGRPELHDIVAETIRRGYADGERVIRVPRVVVYRHGSPDPGAERR